jgi:hypothetical protein
LCSAEDFFHADAESFLTAFEVFEDSLLRLACAAVFALLAELLLQTILFGRELLLVLSNFADSSVGRTWC